MENATAFRWMRLLLRCRKKRLQIDNPIMEPCPPLPRQLMILMPDKRRKWNRFKAKLKWKRRMPKQNSKRNCNNLKT